MTDVSSFEARLIRIEDLEQIRTLAIKYCLVVDERDYVGIRALFSPDARLRTQAGRSKGENRDEVVQYFVDHMPDLGPSNHFTHGHVVDFDPAEPTTATGTVVSHAEFISNGAPRITAMRYYDTYVKLDGTWYFSERIQSYMYMLDPRDYAEALGERLRNRGNKDNWAPADWPALFT
jgi:hypothetical protein